MSLESWDYDDVTCAPVLKLTPSTISIGRVTEGLLLDGIAQQVDVVEPIARFTAKLQTTPGVRHVFNLGLEDWQPSEGVQYDLVWVQWCVGHLTDKQLVEFLERCKTALKPDGVIVVKENNSTSGEDHFDGEDSSVTRCVSHLLPSGVPANTKIPETTATSGASLPRQGCVSSWSSCKGVSISGGSVSCRCTCTH